MKMPKTSVLWMVGSLGLAGAAGGLGAVAISGANAQAPTKTVTIEITNGTTGPQGPAGEQGPPGPAGPPGADGTGGAENCPTGSTFSALQFVIQGQGPTTIYTCVVD
jgi:hypothetical protein